MDKNIEFKTVEISTDYITLGQLLKFQNVIHEGGEAKEYILAHEILIDGENHKERGKKLYPGTKIIIDNSLFFEIKKWLLIRLN